MKKVRQPKSAHRKTQTPIVAKQISSSGKDVSSHNNLPGPALLPNPQRYCARKKAYLSLRGKHILQLLMKFVWHPNYTTHSFLLQENSEKMLRKSLFCRKTHGGMQSRPARIRRANRLLAAILLADCRANAPAPQTGRIAAQRRRRSGERGADGPAAGTAAGPSAQKRRERRKRLSRLVCHVSFAVCIVRLPPIRGRDAGRRSFRHQEEFVDHPLGAIALLGLPQTL